MIASIVPQEIINAIIESLPTPLSSSTLRTCSLVSSSFRDPAQRQLFKVIHVSLLPPLRSRNTTLCGTLIDDPRLCSFVKALHIFIGSESFDVDMTFSTLTRLRRLNHLSLTARDAGAKWESLPKSFQRDVCEILLVTTTLRSLTLRNIKGFPTHAICQCPQLLALDVWSAWFYRVPGQPCDGSETQGYLQKLRLGGDTTIGPLQCSLLGGSSPLSIARLRRMNAEIWSDMSFTELIKLLELSGSYMEDLELTIFAVPTNFQALPPINKLQTFTLHPQDHAVFRKIPTFFESFPPINNLTEVAITGDARLLDNESDIGTWRRLDELLTRKRHDVWLRLVKITIPIYSYKAATVASENDSVLGFFRETMPALVGVGKLGVDVQWPGTNFPGEGLVLVGNSSES